MRCAREQQVRCPCTRIRAELWQVTAVRRVPAMAYQFFDIVEPCHLRIRMGHVQTYKTNENVVITKTKNLINCYKLL
jgi:hypothetical protein